MIKMSIKDIVKDFRTQKKKIEELQEDPFARIAFIIESDNETTGFNQEVDKILFTDTDEFAKQNLSGMAKNDLKLIERNPEQNLSINPLYVVDDIRNLPVITKVAKALEPVPWIVYYCKTKNDLLYALIVQRMGYTEAYKEQLEDYTLESVSRLAILRRVRDYANSVLEQYHDLSQTQIST